MYLIKGFGWASKVPVRIRQPGRVGLGGRYKFALGPFYTFVALALMVLYQLESLNMDDYNLTYSQNKKKGFEIFLPMTPLKLHHFLYTKFLQNQS